MHALIPLFLVLILFNRRQLQTDKLYRANVFALVGISYFFLYQYTIYWYRIFPTESALQFAPGVAIVLSTVLFALSPWNKKSHPVKTVILCVLCGSAIAGTLGFDTTIKEKLAEQGGYFEDQPITEAKLIHEDFNTVDLAEIGMQLNLSPEWGVQTSESGHTYFQLQANTQLIAELRPNCMGDFEIDTPTFVLNTLALFETNAPGAANTVKCTKENGVKECLLIVEYAASADIREKWRWFKTARNPSTSIMIDVLIFADDVTQKEWILNLFASARPMKKGPTEPCLTPSAWL